MLLLLLNFTRLAFVCPSLSSVFRWLLILPRTNAYLAKLLFRDRPSNVLCPTGQRWCRTSCRGPCGKRSGSWQYPTTSSRPTAESLGERVCRSPPPSRSVNHGAKFTKGDIYIYIYIYIYTCIYIYIYTYIYIYIYINKSNNPKKVDWVNAQNC